MTARYPDVAEARLVPELVRDLIGRDGQRRARRDRGGVANGMRSADAVRAAGRPLAGFSDAMAAEERALKAFLHARMYDAPAGPGGARGGAAHPRRPVRRLSRRSGPPAGGMAAGLGRSGDGRLRAVGDFIAGMTDRYAVRRYQELIGPAELPDGF